MTTTAAPIVVERAGMRVSLSPSIESALHAQFEAAHHLRLPGFFGPDMLAQFRARLAGAEFSTRVEHGIEIEHTLEEPSLVGLMLIALNDPALFALVDRLTGCGSIGCFSGRVQRRGGAGAPRHYYPWHTDAVRGRLVGLSVNLGGELFEGGVLQLRRVRGKAMVAEVRNTGAGDAVLFRISRALEHHVTPVTGSDPRLVLAGWFRRAPDFWAKARGVSASAG